MLPLNQRKAQLDVKQQLGKFRFNLLERHTNAGDFKYHKKESWEEFGKRLVKNAKKIKSIN